jgi:autotransporter strand-loop-strand O-heptosyltransferase
MIYDNLVKNSNPIREVQNKVVIHFVKGPVVQINGPKNAEYTIEFKDSESGVVHYVGHIKNNMWTRCSIEYFVKWKITIWENGKLFHEHVYDANDKRVYVALDSKALGDTIAWFPMAVQFSKLHNCKLIVSTFSNNLIDKSDYPQIEFVEPGTNVNDLYAMYSLGLFYNEDNTINGLKNPIDPKSVTMQKMASDILGIPHIEIKPKLKKRIVKKDSNIKQITIGIYGTAQPKFWNNPTGWQELVDWLNGRGYTVKLLSKEGDNYMGNKLPTGMVTHPAGPIEGVMDEMLKSEAFIGIGSGLSWLSWALNVPTVLISGFSYKWAEMEDCIRIGTPQGKCEGCFNRLRLDAGDWNWCPDHKGTERQFECTKSITSEMVINELEKFL